MARLTFPSDRLVYTASTYAGSAFTSAANAVATVYSDSAGTILADVQNLDGSANATATFTVDTTSRLPQFLGPAAGTDTLYVQVGTQVGTGPVTAIYAVTAGDISAAVGTEVTNRTAADAAHVAASNPHSVTPQLIGAPTVVVHGSTAGTARPTGATVVYWIGSVAPTNVATNDEWTDTANKILKRWNGASFDSLGSAASLTVQDEGTPLATTADTLNFVGAGVTATGTTGTKTITIPGAGGITFTDQGNWITAHSYVVGDTVTQNSHRYTCATAHTSGTFATDLAAGKWVLEGDTGALIAANNLSDVAVAATARTNLGLGTAATHPVGDFAQTANNLSDVTAATARTNLGLGALATKATAAVPGDLSATGTPSSATFLNGAGAWATPAGGSSGGWAAVMASLQWTQVYPGTNSGGTIGANQTLLAFPFLLENSVSITDVAITVSTIGAVSSTIRLGIYDTTASLPASLLSDFGTVAGDTTGTKTITLGSALPLTGGHLYYFAYCVLTSSTVPAVQNSWSVLNNCAGPVTLPNGTTAGNVAVGSFIQHSSAVTGALPATFSPTYQGNTRSTPSFAFKAQ